MTVFITIWLTGWFITILLAEMAGNSSLKLISRIFDTLVGLFIWPLAILGIGLYLKEMEDKND